MADSINSGDIEFNPGPLLTISSEFSATESNNFTDVLSMQNNFFVYSV